MNNDLQQNDRLYEHGYDVRLGLAAPTEATLSVSPLHKQTAPIVSATLYGPFCKFSNTLPYKIPLRAESNSTRWSVTVPDVCYWTPNLPMHYRLTLQLPDSRQLTTWVALKRFGVKGPTLSMDGERYVLRGFSTRGLDLSASNDDAWKSLREQRAVLVLEQLAEELVQRAGWSGLPVLWDARGEQLTPEKLLAARAFPAVLGLMTTADQQEKPALDHAANELLWIIDAEAATQIRLRDTDADERKQVAALIKPDGTWSDQLPLLVQLPLQPTTSLGERRKECDKLQAQTASQGVFAGYLLL